MSHQAEGKHKEVQEYFAKSRQQQPKVREQFFPACDSLPPLPEQMEPQPKAAKERRGLQ